MKSGSSFDVVILAGGKSRRFGVDKCSYEWNGEALLKRVVNAFETSGIEPIVVTDRHRGFKREVIDYIKLGPFHAIKLALGLLESEKVFVTACDYPFVDTKLPEVLCRLCADAVVPVFGFPHYLLGCYRKDVFNKECHSFKDCIGSAYYISFKELNYYKVSRYTFINVNRLTDLILSPPPSLIREKGAVLKTASTSLVLYI